MSLRPMPIEIFIAAMLLAFLSGYLLGLHDHSHDDPSSE